MSPPPTRRRLLAGIGLAAPALALGYYGLPRYPEVKRYLLGSGERLSLRAHQLIGPNALAREYSPSAISPVFRTNGSIRPKSPQWAAQAADGFASWRLRVDGKVRAPRDFSLAELQAFPARTQITRHDCVEGWSAIGQWTGVPLATLLREVGLTDEARFIVFWCADVIRGWQYYESLDLIEAAHPQTIVAYGMNGAPLPIGHGAPARLRVERQLGYKQAKFLMRIEAVTSLKAVKYGHGGFWEDAAGYQWYAGI